MKTFLLGLALGFGVGLLLLPKNGNEHDELIRERTRELQRSLPQHKERELQSAAIQARDRFSVPRRPRYESRAGALRAGIHPLSVLNMASEKQLARAGIAPESVSRIVASRPYASLSQAMDRGLLSFDDLSRVEKLAESAEPLPLQPLA